MRIAVQTLRQFRYDNRAFWRNPAAAFFTFVFPLMFLVLFNVIFGDNKVEIEGGVIDTSNFYVPAIVAFSVINACYTGLSQVIAFARDRGLLKRIRGTPLPPAAFIGGRILQSVWASIILVVLTVAFGAVFYGVDIPTDKLPALVVTLLIGAACFSALGLAVSGFIPNADAAPAIINASILPLLFISDIFIPSENSPHWLTDFASLFPIIHFSHAMVGIFSPFETGSGFEPKDLAVIAAWGIAGAVVAARYFSWEPRK